MRDEVEWRQKAEYIVCQPIEEMASCARIPVGGIWLLFVRDRQDAGPTGS